MHYIIVYTSNDPNCKSSYKWQMKWSENGVRQRPAFRIDDYSQPPYTNFRVDAKLTVTTTTNVSIYFRICVLIEHNISLI